ncbi:MAG: serine/threonine protein kinase, partial [bacterium]|nr:serine/threonine protein kinase [bacterium]
MGKELDRLRLYNYKLDRILGRGGTGTVYRGIDTESGNVVAIKLFHQNFFRNRMHVRELARVVPRFEKFDHPNVVGIYGFMDGEEGTCLIQEYVDGPDLKWYLGNRPWNLQERLVIVAQMCNGLQYIHDQGFTHHDLKPANVLFTRKGQLKLVDYSLSFARLFSLFDAGLFQQVTPMYVAPELIKKEKATPRSDIYSLGV